MSFTYPEVGATRGRMPPGYLLVERRRRIGMSWERAAAEVMSWGLKTRSGFRVRRSVEGPVVEGETAELRAGIGALRVGEPVRVVYTVDEGDRRGFAYGTLAGHPLIGEESFVVSRVGHQVWLDIRSFSRPAGRWRLVTPLLRFAQRMTHSRYLRALG